MPTLQELEADNDYRALSPEEKVYVKRQLNLDDPLQTPEHLAFVEREKKAKEMGGARKFYEGLKGSVKGLVGGMAAPFRSPEDNARLQEELKLQDHLGTPGRAGKFMGDVLPYLAGPRPDNIALRTLGMMGMGGAIEGGRMPEEGGSRLLNAATGIVGGGVGEILPGIAAKGYNIATGQAYKEPAKRELRELSKKHGITLTAAEYNDPKSAEYIFPKGRWASNLPVPFAGKGAREFERLGQQEKAFKGLFGEITGENYDEFVKVNPSTGKPVQDSRWALASTLKRQFQKIKDDVSALYEDRDRELANVLTTVKKGKGPMPMVETPNFSREIDRLQSGYGEEAIRQIFEPGLADKISKSVAKGGLQDLSVQELFEAEKALKGLGRGEAKKIISSGKSGVQYRDLSIMLEALEKDSDQFFSKNPTFKSVQAADQLARKAYRTDVAPRMDVPVLRKLLYEDFSKIKYENIVDSFVTKNDIHTPDMLMKTLPPKGQKLAKAEALNKLFSSSFDGDIFKADKFVAHMESMFGADTRYSSLRKILSPSEMQQLEGLTKLYKHTSDVGANIQNLGGQASMSRTSAAVGLSGAAGASSLASGAPQRASQGLGFAAGVSQYSRGYLWLMGSEKGRQLLMTASKLDTGSKAWNRVMDRADSLVIEYINNGLNKKLRSQDTK